MKVNLDGLNILKSDVNIYDLDFGVYYFEDILVRLSMFVGCMRFSKITNDKETEEISILYKSNYNKTDMFNNVFCNIDDCSVKSFYENWSLCDIEIIEVYRKKHKTSSYFNPFSEPKKVDFSKKINSRKLSNSILTGQLKNCKYVSRYTDDYYNDSQVNYMRGRDYPIGKLAQELIESDSFKFFKLQENKIYVNNSCTTLVLELAK